MKKNIIIAACVLVVLVLIFFVIQFFPFWKSDEQPAVGSNISVFSVEKDKIVGIDVNLGTEYYELVKTKDVWSFKGEEGINAIQPKVDGIAYDISNLYAERVIEKNASDFKMYGLDPAVSTVVVHLEDGTMHTFFVGNRVQDKNQYYFANDMDRTVYAIGNGKGMVLTYKKDDLISTTMQEIYKGDIDEITITRNDGYSLKVKQNLESETESWILTEPYFWATDETEIQNKLLNFVVGLSAISYEKNKTDEEMGLSKPHATVSVLKTDGSVHNFYIGNLVEDYCYVRVDGVKYAGLINSEIRKLTEVTAFDIMNKNIQMADYYGLSSLTLEGNKNFTLVYDKQKPTLNDKVISPDTFIRLYSAVCTLKVDEEAKAPKLGSAVMKVTFNYAAGYDYVYTVYNFDSRNYIVTHDDKTFFKIRKDTYTTWLATMEKYL